MRPKRSIPLLKGSLAVFIFVALAAISGVIGGRSDAYVAEHWGSRVAAVTGWDYLPTFIACCGMVAIYLWSQSAPSPEIQTVIEYRDPPPLPPPIRIPLGDALWEDRYNSVVRGTPPVAFCAKHPHTELLFDNSYGNGVRKAEPIGRGYPRGAFTTSPWCVECNESVNVGDADFFNAQRIAKTKIDGERRKRAGDLG